MVLSFSIFNSTIFLPLESTSPSALYSDSRRMTVSVAVAVEEALKG